MNKLKVFEGFAGYGGASFVLKKLGINHEIIGFSEIDKYAIQCYKQNHGDIKNYGDITKIDPNELPDFDLFTGGFPCQSFSLAGKMQGEADPRGTLFYEIIRICEVKKPKFILLENVKGLTTKKFKDTFDKILSELDRIGYDVHWKVLNSKNYGIPQSRSRVWFVCIDRACTLPKDREFKFPESEPLNIFIKDILEEYVDEKYYLSEKLQERFRIYLENKKTSITALRQRDRHGKNEDKQQQLEFREDGCSNTITSVEKDNLLCLGMVEQTCYKRRFETPVEINKYLKEVNHYTMNELSELLGLPKTMVEHYFRIDNSRSVPSPEIWFKLKDLLGFDDTYDKEVTSIYEKTVAYEQTRRVYDEKGISPTLNTIQEPLIYKETAFDTGHRNFRESELCPTLSSQMGTGGNNCPMILGISNASNREMGFKTISPTLCVMDYKDPKVTNIGRLRRLTPIECFRLQGFFEDEIKLESISNSQLYKLCGNGWALRPVLDILRNLLKYYDVVINQELI